MKKKGNRRVEFLAGSVFVIHHHHVSIHRAEATDKEAERMGGG